MCYLYLYLFLYNQFWISKVKSVCGACEFKKSQTGFAYKKMESKLTSEKK